MNVFSMADFIKVFENYRFYMLSGLDIVYAVVMAFENGIILVSRIFFGNFDFINGSKNEFRDNNEKSWS